MKFRRVSPVNWLEFSRKKKEIFLKRARSSPRGMERQRDAFNPARVHGHKVLSRRWKGLFNPLFNRCNGGTQAKKRKKKAGSKLKGAPAQIDTCSSPPSSLWSDAIGCFISISKNLYLQLRPGCLETRGTGLHSPENQISRIFSSGNGRMRREWISDTGGSVMDDGC